MILINSGTQGELKQLLASTSKEKPPKADLERLQIYLVQHPDQTKSIGNLAHQVQLNILDQAFRSNQGIETVIAVHCRGLRKELGYDNASILEQMLIDCVVVAWLRMYDCELRFESVRQDNISLAVGLYWEKKLSAAQRRFLRASEALARVRRLLKDPPEPTSPTLAILMKQQLNVGR